MTGNARRNANTTRGNVGEPGEILEGGTGATSTITPSATQPSDPQTPQEESTESADRLAETHATRRQQLETFVQDFRDGKKSRVETLSAILRELEREPQLTTEEKESTFSLFSSEIDSTEARAHRQLAITGINVETVPSKPD